MPKGDTRKKRSAGRFKFNWTVVPDRVDLRDRPYQPSVTIAPARELDSLRGAKVPVLDQGRTSACTGFALANVVNFLRQRDRRRTGQRREPAVSPFMLYSMARRYDEFPGATADAGSSLRGAMKGWYRHGVCRESLWKTERMPRPRRDPRKDWWQDAARRPLGAYYRVDTRSVADMHVALNDVGVLYASAICHDGWYEPEESDARIPVQKGKLDDGGHAFVIVGYNEHGFLVLNSWGKDWGTDGVAVLAYEDWLENAMDCWVAQLGVVTAQHRAVAAAPSLRLDSTGTVRLAADWELRKHEIAPFIVNMSNNGKLSTSGNFRTTESDLRSLVFDRIPEARKAWGLASRDPIDIAIYAHGGLTGEKTAAHTAAEWIPRLYEERIFPIFLMWETDLWSTLKNALSDLVRGVPRPTRGPLRNLDRWWSTRLESTLAGPGSAIWREMKQNAWAIAHNERSGARLLFEIGNRVLGAARVRLHLIGHSAGSIVHCHVAPELALAGYEFASVTFLAAAVRLDVFEDTLAKTLASGHVHQLHAFHLTDEAEQRDPTCRPLFGYDRSLLYLVSESFEGGHRTPILGMDRYFQEWHGRTNLENVEIVSAPTAQSASTTHGGFDDDPITRTAVIERIKQTRGN